MRKLFYAGYLMLASTAGLGMGCGGGTNSCQINWGSDSDQGNYCQEYENGSSFGSSCLEGTALEGKSCSDQGYAYFCDEGDG